MPTDPSSTTTPSSLPVPPELATSYQQLAALFSLASRELVRFARQRNRVVGAVGQPVLFWILFSAGLGPTFQLVDAAGRPISYREYFFPGTMALILLFTAIFTTISIIEDRREGFLQSVLVAPIGRSALVLGKLLGGTLIALAQAAIFLLLGLAIGLSFTPLGLAALLLFSFLLAFALCGLGFAIAWRLDSTQGFHAIMSLFLLPMWLLSGAFFPAAGSGSLPSTFLAWIIRANPMTYGVAGLRHLIYHGAAADLPLDIPSLPLCWIVTLLFAAATFALSWHAAGKRTTGDLL